MWTRWTIRKKLFLGVSLLLIAVTILAISGFRGAYAFRGLVRGISRRATELPSAVALAQEEGIPTTWLHENARGWVPPRPPGAEDHPTTPGLTVRWAPPEHLLAMKLVALRGRDAPDVVALSRRLGLGADSGEYADLLRRVYAGEDALQQILGVPHDSVDDEALRRGEAAVALMQRSGRL